MSPKVLAAFLCALAAPRVALGGGAHEGGAAAEPAEAKVEESAAVVAEEARGGEAPVQEAEKVAEEGAEVAEAVASSGFTEGFLAGFSEEGGLAEDEVTCIKSTLKELMKDLAETMEDLTALVLKFQGTTAADVQGEIRKIIGKVLEAMELMQALVKECMNQEARQKIKGEIKTLVLHLMSFRYMKNSIVTQWRTIEKDIIMAVTEFVNKHYEAGGEALGRAMQVLLNSPAGAVEKYSVEDNSILSRMFGTGANYYSSVLIALGVAFVLFVVFGATRLWRVRKVRAPMFSRSTDAQGVMTNFVDTEAPRSAAPLADGESDGELVE